MVYLYLFCLCLNFLATADRAIWELTFKAKLAILHHKPTVFYLYFEMMFHSISVNFYSWLWHSFCDFYYYKFNYSTLAFYNLDYQFFCNIKDYIFLINFSFVKMAYSWEKFNYDLSFITCLYLSYDYILDEIQFKSHEDIAKCDITRFNSKEFLAENNVNFVVSY